jgi:hypothetical protein
MVNRYWGKPGEKSVTREELYEMVWKEPVTKVAPRFGISDVALRKICVKHQIPTPDLGYWAKLQHGKMVKKRPLPALTKGELPSLYLFERPIPVIPSDIAEAKAKAVEKENADDAKIVVPSARPEKLHHSAASVERVLKKAKPDHEGFVDCKGPGLISVMVAPASVVRVTVLIDTFLKALAARGHIVSDDDHGVVIKADDELFRFGIVETKDQKPHIPSPAELKEQERTEQWRRQVSNLYADPARKTYRTWDKFPSGRLSMTVWGANWNQWRGTTDVSFAGRWYDRSTKLLEENLNAAMVALSATAAAIKHEKAVAAEEARRAKEEAERRTREAARRHRIELRQKFLRGEARKLAAHIRLEQLSDRVGKMADISGSEPVDKILRVLKQMVQEGEQRYSRNVFNLEIERLGLIAEDDTV